MDEFDTILAYQQKVLNETVECAEYDLSNPAVLAASIEYDRLTNEWMGI